MKSNRSHSLHFIFNGENISVTTQHVLLAKKSKNYTQKINHSKRKMMALKKSHFQMKNVMLRVPLKKFRLYDEKNCK